MGLGSRRTNRKLRREEDFCWAKNWLFQKQIQQKPHDKRATFCHQLILRTPTITMLTLRFQLQIQVLYLTWCKQGPPSSWQPKRSSICAKVGGQLAAPHTAMLLQLPELCLGHCHLHFLAFITTSPLFLPSSPSPKEMLSHPPTTGCLGSQRIKNCHPRARVSANKPSNIDFIAGIHSSLSTHRTGGCSYYMTVRGWDLTPNLPEALHQLFANFLKLLPSLLHWLEALLSTGLFYGQYFRETAGSRSAASCNEWMQGPQLTQN